MDDSPLHTDGPRQESEALCVQLIERLYDGLAQYFASREHVSVDRGPIRHEGEDYCTMPVIFHAIADLTYVLHVRMRNGSIVFQVRSDTIHEHVEILWSVEEQQFGDLSDEAAAIYDAIDMDIRRILFTDS